MRCVFAFALLAGCSSLSSSTLSADDELILSSINGPEETLASRAAFGAVSTEEDPDAPPLFHECDPDGFHAELFEDYDADTSGALDGTEPDDVSDAHAGRDDMERRQAEMRMHMLGLIYDTDESGDLSTAEKSVLFEDFTVRCDTLNAMLLADFDADGDGTLSESELQTAADTLNADREAMRAEMDERAGEAGDPLGAHGERPEPGSRGVPPGLEDFDTDSDGQFSDAELATCREALRERIRSGEPMFEPPPPPEAK